jgi:hypothetical protein
VSWEPEVAVLAVRDLADLLRKHDAPQFVIDPNASTDQQRDDLLMRLRYEALVLPGVNWLLCDCLKASDNEQRAYAFRVAAMKLEHEGWTHELLVALLAAGHDLDDARDATDVISKTNP